MSVERRAVRLPGTMQVFERGWLSSNSIVFEIRRLDPDSPEVVLEHRQCKGHVGGHGRRNSVAYGERLRSLSLEP